VSDWAFVSPFSSVLGASALKAAAAATPSSSSVKRKDASSGSDSRREKKKKSALEEIIEVAIACVFVFGRLRLLPSVLIGPVMAFCSDGGEEEEEAAVCQN